MSFSILYTWVTPALILRYSSVGRPDFPNLFEYEKFLHEYTSLLARRWTISKAILSFLYRINIVPANGACPNQEKFSPRAKIEPETSSTEGQCTNHYATTSRSYTLDSI